MFLLHYSTYAATTETSTLSLHDALPISRHPENSGDLGCGERHDLEPAVSYPSLDGELIRVRPDDRWFHFEPPGWDRPSDLDRKSTRLNSSHQIISYAVFCLKKKKQIHKR